MFSSKCCEIFKINFFRGHLPTVRLSEWKEWPILLSSYSTRIPLILLETSKNNINTNYTEDLLTWTTTRGTIRSIKLKDGSSHWGRWFFKKKVFLKISAVTSREFQLLLFWDKLDQICSFVRIWTYTTCVTNKVLKKFKKFSQRILKHRIACWFKSGQNYPLTSKSKKIRTPISQVKIYKLFWNSVTWWDSISIENWSTWSFLKFAFWDLS